MNVSCATLPACVDRYAQSLSHAIHHGLFAAAQGVRHGAFVDTCNRHCDDGIALPFNLTVDSTNPWQSFAIWYGSDHNNSRTLWEVRGTMAKC